MTMEVSTVSISSTDAYREWRRYQSHRLNQGAAVEADREIERIYKLIASGKKVIRALDSIVKAGVNAEGLPKLAIVRAVQDKCYLYVRGDGSMVMSAREHPRSREAREMCFQFPAGTIPGKQWKHFQAIVPHIPPHIRPARGLANYHILWEAEWSKVIPVDPMLLRRIGTKGDMWLVCGAWDLTEVERAVLAGRL